MAIPSKICGVSYNLNCNVIFITEFVSISAILDEGEDMLSSSHRLAHSMEVGTKPVQHMKASFFDDMDDEPGECSVNNSHYLLWHFWSRKFYCSC